MGQAAAMAVGGDIERQIIRTAEPPKDDGLTSGNTRVDFVLDPRLAFSARTWFPPHPCTRTLFRRDFVSLQAFDPPFDLDLVGSLSQQKREILNTAPPISTAVHFVSWRRFKQRAFPNGREHLVGFESLQTSHLDYEWQGNRDELLNLRTKVDEDKVIRLLLYMPMNHLC